MNNILRIRNIEKYYGNRTNLTKAIDNISFDVNEGEFVAIMGASGSGKTTLLNCIATIDRVSAGHIYVEGNDITELNDKQLAAFRRDKLGFIFQDFNLLDTLTAYENIALALSIQKVNYKEIDRRIREMSVKLILADEPTGALDSKSSKMLLERLQYLNNDLSATILMVTHDTFSASYASRVIFIKDGKIFNEIIRGNKSRKEFFDEIIDVISLLGGDLSDAL